MSQRYFLTAESTYEDLRQALNTALAYPNALGKSVFQTALYAPRDNFRRVLLAVDTDLPGYATVSDSIAPLLASDAMEEIDEATYLAALASATAGGSSDSLASAADTLTLDGNAGATFSFAGDGCEFRFVSQAYDGLINGAIGVDIGNPDGLYLRGGDGDGGVRVYGTDTTLGKVFCAAVVFGNDTTQTTAWTGTVGVADVTGLATVATTNSYNDLDDRSHAITSSDHTATAWRVFYSNGSGVVTELTLGNAGQALISNGAAAAPSWGQAGSNSASDLTTGTLANARMTTRARAAMNLYLWSAFR